MFGATGLNFLKGTTSGRAAAGQRGVVVKCCVGPERCSKYQEAVNDNSRQLCRCWYCRGPLHASCGRLIIDIDTAAADEEGIPAGAYVCSKCDDEQGRGCCEGNGGAGTGTDLIVLSSSKSGKSGGEERKKKSAAKKPAVPAKKLRAKKKLTTAVGQQQPKQPPPSSPQQPKRDGPNRRNRYSLEFKAKVLQALNDENKNGKDDSDNKNNNNDQAVVTVAHRYDVAPSCLRRWKGEANDIMAGINQTWRAGLKSNPTDPLWRITKRLVALYEWNEEQDKPIAITAAVLVNKALETKKELLEKHADKPFLEEKEAKVLQTFTASTSWAKKFARRYRKHDPVIFRKNNDNNGHNNSKKQQPVIKATDEEVDRDTATLTDMSLVWASWDGEDYRVLARALQDTVEKLQAARKKEKLKALLTPTSAQKKQNREQKQRHEREAAVGAAAAAAATAAHQQLQHREYHEQQPEKPLFVPHPAGILQHVQHAAAVGAGAPPTPPPELPMMVAPPLPMQQMPPPPQQQQQQQQQQPTHHHHHFCPPPPPPHHGQAPVPHMQQQQHQQHQHQHQPRFPMGQPPNPNLYQQSPQQQQHQFMQPMVDHQQHQPQTTMQQQQMPMQRHHVQDHANAMPQHHHQQQYSPQQQRHQPEQLHVPYQGMHMQQQQPQQQPRHGMQQQQMQNPTQHNDDNHFMDDGASL